MSEGQCHETGPPETPEIAQPTKAQNISCAKCGYSLVGMTMEKSCPECGTPVHESTHGFYLGFADPLWISTLTKGAKVVAWSIGLVVASFALLMIIAMASAMILRESGIPEEVFGCFTWFSAVVVAGFLVSGTWMLTETGTNHTFDDATPALCRAARVAAGIQFVASLAIGLMFHDDDLGYVLIGSFAGPICLALLLVRLRPLAKRLPSRALELQCRVVSICMFVTVGLAMMSVLGMVLWTQSMAGGGGGPPPAQMIAIMFLIVIMMFVLVGFGIYAFVLFTMFAIRFRMIEEDAREHLQRQSALKFNRPPARAVDAEDQTPASD